MNAFWAVRLMAGAFIYVGIFLVFYNLVRTFTSAGEAPATESRPAVRAVGA